MKHLTHLLILLTGTAFLLNFKLSAQLPSKDVQIPKNKFEAEYSRTYEDHKFIHGLLEGRPTGPSDFIRLYDLIFQEEIAHSSVESGKRIYEQASHEYQGKSIVISLGDFTDVFDLKQLETIGERYKNKQIDLDEAALNLSRLSSERRFVSLVAVLNGFQSFSKSEELLLPEKYQYWNAKFVGSKSITTSIENVQILDESHEIGGIKVNGQNFKIKGANILNFEAFNSVQRRNLNWNSERSCHQVDDIVMSVPINTFRGWFCGECEDGNLNGNVKIIRSLDGVLDNLIIVTDGIDFFNTNTTGFILNGLGGINGLSHWLDQGFDFVILDWPSPMGYIEYNSQYLQGVIQQMADWEDFRAIQALVGISMGGIISRHALLEMEANGDLHHVINWVSGDSPQRGANVSIGVQALLRELFEIDQSDDNILAMLGIIDAPASRQMMKYHIDMRDYLYWHTKKIFGTTVPANGLVEALPDVLHTELMNWLDGRYPNQTVNNLGIADGSFVNTPTTSVGIDILKVVQTTSSILPGTLTTKFTSKASDGNDQLIIHKDYPDGISPDNFTWLFNSVDNVDATSGSTIDVDRFEFSDATTSVSFENDWSYQPVACALDAGGTINDPDLTDTPFDHVYATPSNDPHTFPAIEKLVFIAKYLDYSLVDKCDYLPCDDLEVKTVAPIRFNRYFEKIGDENVVYALRRVDFAPDPLPSSFEVDYDLDVQPGRLLDLKSCEITLPNFISRYEPVIALGNIGGTIYFNDALFRDYLLGFVINEPFEGCRNFERPLLDFCVLLTWNDCGVSRTATVEIRLSICFSLCDFVGNTDCQGGRIECEGGEICVNGECMPKNGCSLENPCPEGYICLDGVCHRICIVKTDCPDGYNCIAGDCIPIQEPGCESHSDCPPYKVCQDGECVELSCGSGLNCPAGYTCFYDVCVKIGQRCNTTMPDCPPGYFCFDGKCIGAPPRLTKINNNNKVFLSPNPTLEQFSIIQEDDEMSEITKVSMYNIHGILTLEEAYQEHFFISDFPSGIYLVKIHFEDGNIAVKRLIKN